MNDILQITIILAFSFIATIISRRIQIPEVVGLMVIGVILSPSLLGWVTGGHTIEVISEVGLILLMFLAGLESDIELLKKYLKPSLLVALTGVFIPILIFGAVSIGLGHDISTSFFYGIVFSATSVSITVQVLQEYGKLSTKAGNIIMGAAVVDDILAILILSVFTSVKKQEGNLLYQFMSEIIFFIFLFLVYKFIPHFWKLVNKLSVPKKHVITALLICLSLSLLANSVGMSAVIGSFFAGLAIAQTKVSDQIESAISEIGNIIFIPVFFVSIAISIDLKSLLTAPMLILCFTILAILTKFVPAYYAGKLFNLDKEESLLIGAGMVSRGEMALIVSQIGITSTIINQTVYSDLVIVIILTTIIAPFLIKYILNK